MTCPELFKLSLLLDGELEESEVEQLRTHLADCPQCSSAWSDFSGLRGELRALAAQAGRDEEEALRRFVASTRGGFWRRRLAVPAPLAAAVAVLLMALVLWIGMLPGGPGISTQGLGLQPPEQVSQPAGGIDFARYDHGARPVIFKQTKPANPGR